MTGSSRIRARLSVAVVLAAVVTASIVVASAPPALWAHRSHVRQPTALTDAEFWNLFVSASEPDGHFGSENFVSNEIQLQDPIPTLQRTLTPNGVYLGVGPDQNLTYIANLKPRLAVIVDIRRANAMQHLLYKALFELSATRAEFVERLFSRPLPKSLGPSPRADALFLAADAVAASDSAFRANRLAVVARLTQTHHFALSAEDLATIEHTFRAFYTAGPWISYASNVRVIGPGDETRPVFATFAYLQFASNADSVQMGFLASDERYRAIRDLEMRNLVVPVVGDFGGPRAIRAVGDFVRRRGLTVTAFYVSNVEQYLFPNKAPIFYASVATLPVDSASVFIRSVARSSVPGGMAIGGAAPATSPGLLRRPQIVGDALVSGIASITQTVNEFTAGRITNYRDVVALTRTGAWR